MITFYKGEDFTLTFTSTQDISGYTKSVSYFTPFGTPVTSVVTPINNFSFSAKFASTDTATLKAGALNVVVTFTDANSNKSISKAMPAQILDSLVNGNIRTADIPSTSLEIVFEQNSIALDINFVGLTNTQTTAVNNLPADTNGALTTLTNNAEVKSNKTSDVEANKTSSTSYPTVKAIVDWITARYITVSQTVAQTIGTTTQRLTKLWATDIDSVNMPTVGGVDLRTALGVMFPQLFDIKAKGDGSGVLKMNITVLYACTATITGGLFYTDVTGTSAGTTSVSLAAGDNSIFMKTSSNATVFVPGLTKIISGGNSGTNIPMLANIVFSPIISYVFISDIDNNIGGSLSIPSTCSTFVVYGSNSLNGTLSIPSGCTTFVLGGNNTVGGLFVMPASCTNFQFGGYNTVGGTLSIPSGCTTFLFTGYNTVGGTLSIPSSVTTFQLGGNNTVNYNLANTPDATKYINLSSDNGGTYTYNTSSGQKTWAQGMREVLIRPKSGVWTSAMTDALLIDLSSVTTWTYEKTIDLRGNCGARTSASNNAVSTLQGNGVTVLTN